MLRRFLNWKHHIESLRVHAMTKKRQPQTPATIDGATLTVLPTSRRIDLKTLNQVRSEMARVYRDMRGGKIRTDDGSRLTYVLGQIGKLIEIADLERRVEELEKANGS